MDSQANIVAPGDKIGSYTLLEKLGSGGLGEVWKARDRRLNRVVALKFISSQRQGSSTTRDLLREARAASALNHPNIVTIFEVGESPGGTFLAMEFVEGETLRSRMKRAPVPSEEALDIAQQTAGALAVAHRQGIVHRDLKPENIMLRVDGYVKLLDFGLAKVLPWAQAPGESTAGSHPTESGQLVGTFTYMSPEQARGHTVNPASDIFSFGIILYELLTSEHPFRADSAVDTLTAIISKEPAPVNERSSSVSRPISDVVARALRKDAGQRFGSAAEMAEELQRARKAQQEPAARAEAAPAATRHKPRWMQAVGAVLIALLLGLAVWFLRQPSAGGEMAASIRSVAVMNFRAESDDARAAPLARSLPEDLGAALSRTGLSVAPRSSVLALAAGADSRTAGTQLGVDAVLEGSVRSYGNKVRLHLELVSTCTGFQVWSGTVTLEGEEAIGTEEKQAGEIARQIREALSGKQQ